MRVTTEGLEELNSYEPSPEPYFNENVGAWDDQLGHFSYDGGATWGAARSYAAAPAPVSTAGAMESLGNTYSLNGPAFDDFNIGTLTPEPDIPVWDEATQGYRDKWGNYSYDGGVTWGPPRYYAPPPVSTAGALAQLPEGPTDRASFIDYEGANAGNPFDAPGFESPWMPPAMQDDGDGGGLWGGFKNALGNIAEVGTVPYQLANEVADRLTGSTQQERWESNVSGNQFADLVTGGRADLEDLPYGLGYVTDAALAPATWLTAGVGPSVPVIGSTFSGNVGKRLAGEIAIGVAGLKGSELGAEYAPEVIPNYSVPNIDAEILGRDVLLGDEALNFLGSDAGQSVVGGIAGGLLGGVGAYGGLKGLDAALNLGAVDEAIPSIYKASPFRVGDEAQFPAFAKDITVPPGRAIPQVAGAADDIVPPVYKRLSPSTPPSRIPTVTTGSDLEALADQGNLGPLFVRWSRSIKDDVQGGEQSWNALGHSEKGLSAIELAPPSSWPIEDRAQGLMDAVTEYRFAGDGKPWIVTGEVVGIGGDGEPLLRNVRVVAKVASDELVANRAAMNAYGRDLAAQYRETLPRFAKPPSVPAAESGAPWAIRNIETAMREAGLELPGSRPSFADEWLSGRSVTATATPPPPKPPVAAADTALNEPRRKLLDALDEQRRFRESGQADEIIHAGRVQQAKGIAAATGNLGDTFAESLDSMRAGASVGKMLPAGQSLGLDDDTTLSLLKEAIEFNGGKQFDNYRAAKALSKLQNGEKLQPGEIKMLGRIYGDEVERAIRETNAGRIATVAELTPDDIVKINEQARVDGKRAAVLEAQARRQHELADDLQRQARMDPTNKRLAKAVDDARARAIAKENEADRVLAERANALAEKQNKTALKAEQSAARAENKADVAAQLREDKAAMTAANKARLTASDEQSVNFAKNVVARMDASDDLKSALVDSIDLAVERNRQVLDGFGEDGPGIVRTLYAVATGEVTDSYTAALLMQEANLRSALEMQGMTPQMARGAAKLVREAEIKRRFGAEVPEWVTRSFDQAKPASYQSVRDDPVAALASLSQTIKNTQFGIGDLAVFGQQALKAGTTNSAAILAGIVNRTLGVVGVKPLGDITEGLGKRVAYQLDGVAQGSRGSITDLTHQKTLISTLGRPGRFLDEKFFVPRTQQLTDFQFGTVLGGLRNLIYEGNLLMAKAAGADITDAAVRRNAAAFANAATGAGQLAQRTSRANVEKAFLLSPSMRRAQAQQIGQVARLLSPTASRETRILAAATIVSTGAAIYGVGKLLNDWIGLDEFEFDPSKPGFGNITLADGTVVNLFPQEQLPKAMARSLGILAREGIGEEQAKGIAEEWGKLLVSSASPAIRPALAAVGVGYDPGRGYAWGDLGTGKGGWERALDMAPFPPIATQIAREGVGAVLTPANFLGVNAYTESQYDKIDRQVKNDPTYGGRGYSELSPIEKQEVQEKFGKLEPFGPEGERAAEVLAQKISQQEASDTMRSQGVLDPEQWRRDYQARKDELRITNDEIYAELRKSGKLDTKDPILKPYYAAMAAAEGPDGKLDWSKVDAYRATLAPAENDYISKNTGLIKIDTPAVREFEAARDAIESSGYFDRSADNWHNVVYYAPTWDGGGKIKPVNPKDYASYDEWRTAALQTALDSVGATREDIGTVTQINAWLDKQEPAKGMEAYGKKWKDDWVWENPRAAYDAWRYGYYNPRKAIKEWLMEKYE